MRRHSTARSALWTVAAVLAHRSAALVVEDRCRDGAYRSLDPAAAPWRPGCAGFVVAEPGFFASGGLRFACPPGTFSSSPGSSSCEPCAAGFVCVQAFDPSLDAVRGSTSRTQTPCGAASVFCPPGSGSPSRVPTGSFSTGSADPATRTGSEPCPAGTFCADGVRALCPPGRYGAGPSRTSALCDGPCRQGHFCPQGSTSPNQHVCGGPGKLCPAGSGRPVDVPSPPASGPASGDGANAVYVTGSLTEADAALGTPSLHDVPSLPSVVGDESSLTAAVRSAAAPCPRGFYCPPGSGVRVPCPAGRFGSARGAASAEHCAPCAAGHFCPAGSAVATQAECGADDVFCPAGSAAPARSRRGYRTVGGGRTTRSAEAPCPRGHRCPGDGTASLCPAGTYAAEPGQAACQPCAAGFWCGEGSANATQHSCGAAARFCPPGSPSPLASSPGYYTLRVEPAAAPAALVASAMAVGGRSFAPGAWSEGALGPAGLTAAFAGGTMSAGAAADVRAAAAGSPDAWQWQRRLTEDQHSHPGTFWLVPPLASDTAAALRTAPGGGTALVGAGTAQQQGLAAAAAGGAAVPAAAAWLGAAAPQHLHPLLLLPSGSSAPSAACDGTTAASCWSDGAGPTLLVPPSAASAAVALLAGITDDTAAFRTHERRCDAGHFCVGDGTRSPCPAGTFGNATGLTAAGQCEPCPAGHVCPAASVSGTARPCGGVDRFCPAGSSSPTPVSPGHFTTGGASSATRTGQSPCPPGVFCVGGHQTPCPAGRYGSAAAETRPDCEGGCAPGHYCPQGSTSPTQRRCGGSGVFCPAGSALPLAAAAGWYTVGGLTTADGGQTAAEQPLDCRRAILAALDPSTTLGASPPALRGPMADVPFDRERFCTSGVIGDPHTRQAQVPCEPGAFCASGLRYECPPGRAGPMGRETSPQCALDCLEGHTCGWASTSPDPVPCGGAHVFCPPRSGTPTPVSPGRRTDPGQDPARRSRELGCPPGSFCAGGEQAPCRAGSFGARVNETSPHCSGPCDPGHFCSAGSASPRQHQCGGSAVYCPIGSSAPLPVLPGFFSVGGLAPAANATRSDVTVCPVGHFCSGGILRQCPAGVLGNASGLSDPACTRPCPEGYFCPPGSTTTPLRCGDVFVNGSLSEAVILRGGLNFSELYEPYAGVAAGGFAVGAGALGGLEARRRLAGLAAASAPLGAVLAWESGARPRLPTLRADLRSAASEFSLPITVGPAAVYCPPASGWPVPVKAGWESTGAAANDTAPERNGTRTASRRCPAGSFCVAGIRMPCPPGTYGATVGLATRGCTATCPAGHACPLGTVRPTPCPDGTFAAGGNHACTPCPGDAEAARGLFAALEGTAHNSNPGRGPVARCKTSRECCLL